MPREEVATIQSDIEFLNRNTFRPFIEVTTPMTRGLTLETDPTITDGLMSSHMHFRNIEGADLENATPISLDNNQLASFLQSEEYAAWRANGILMSDSLGVPAIRRYYQSAGDEFRPKQVAFNAFNAGHDLLYLDDFWTSINVTETVPAFQNISETIEAFEQRYESDGDFRTRVDAAVRRILRLKLRMYLDPAALVAPTNEPATTPPSSSESVSATQSVNNNNAIE